MSQCNLKTNKFVQQYFLILVRHLITQGSVIDPILYNIIPSQKNATIATFADGTAIFTTSQKEATNDIQQTLNILTNWINKWRVQINEGNFIHISFTNKHITHTHIFINVM